MSNGFNKDNFKCLFELEEKNFWFQGRNHLIISAMQKYLHNPQTYLEIGCGTGFVTQAVHRAFPDCQIIASELFGEAIEYAKTRLPKATFIQSNATDLSETNQADFIGIFDVLEHIPEDELVLANIHKILKPGGLLFLTVPQHEWLWSDQDDVACHVRRYTARDLHRKLKASGFRIQQSTSFITTLLPAMLLSRLFKNKKINKNYQSNPESELKLPPFLNRLFYFLVRFDLLLIKTGIKLPVGGSRFIVARKD